MYGLTKEEKRIFILEQVEKHSISAYEISKNTNLTDAGVGRILNGSVKNPHENTLNTIIDYLESKALKAELRENIHIIKEPKNQYGFEKQTNELLDCLKERNKLTTEIFKLQSILRKNNIKFNDYFEENN